MFQNGFFGYPVLFNTAYFQDNNTKLIYDSYEVYVNRDYVGKKILVGQNEKISDVEEYLKDQGFHNFTTRLDGNHFLINSDGSEAQYIKRNLHIYLNLK